MPRFPSQRASVGSTPRSSTPHQSRPTVRFGVWDDFLCSRTRSCCLAGRRPGPAGRSNPHPDCHLLRIDTGTDCSAMIRNLLILYQPTTGIFIWEIRVQGLTIIGGRIRGPGLAHLKNAPNLQTLGFRGNHFGDSQIRHLRLPPSCRALNLMHEDITDDALQDRRTSETTDIAGGVPRGIRGSLAG